MSFSCKSQVLRTSQVTEGKLHTAIEEKTMAARENEEAHLRPACVDCTYHCNKVHAGRDFEEEKFDPDRSWPHFRRQVTKLALHYSPQAALCIPGAFMDEYPNSFPKGKAITLQGPSGNKWKVGATERSVLHPGWRAFAHDHRLREGDQLSFRLTKPSHFVVDVFNSQGEVRRSAIRAIVTGKYANVAASPASTPTLQDHQSRKRKDMATVDRWKTTPARRGGEGIFHEPAVGARLRFSEKTKQWESQDHGRREDHHGVTVDLDSDDDNGDDEEPDEHTRTLNYRSSKIERLIEHMKEEDFTTPPKSKPPATLDAKSQRAIIPGDGEEEEDSVAHELQENDPLDEETQRPSDPLRQFTTIFDTSPMETTLEETLEAEKAAAVMKAKKELKLGSESDPLSRKAQILCDEDTVMVNEEEEEEETHLASRVEAEKAAVVVEKDLGTGIIAEQDTPKEGDGVEEKHQDLEADKATVKTAFLRIGQHETISDNNHINAASNNVLKQSFKVPMAHEAAAGYASVTGTSDVYVESSQVTPLTSITAMSEMYESEIGTEDVKVSIPVNGSRRPQEKKQGELFYFGSALDSSIVEFPVHINTINGGQTDSVHPLKQGLNISHEQQADDLITLKQMEDELQLSTKSNNSAREDSCVLQPLSASKAADKNCDLQEENPNMPVLCDAEKTKSEKERVASTYGNISNPEATPGAAHEKGKNDVQARLAPTSQSFTNACVLGSRRSLVTQVDREKALNAAHAWVRPIRNPHFVAVMKSSHVYTDFNMDVPAEFGKQSKLPTKEVRVTLVCNEVPTNCKAIWMGKDPENPKIDSKGWMNFSRSHFLEEDDVCVFEFFSSTTAFRIGVYIFRVVRLKRPILLDWTRHYKVLETTNATAAASPTHTAVPAPETLNSEEKAP